MPEHGAQLASNRRIPRQQPPNDALRVEHVHAATRVLAETVVEPPTGERRQMGHDGPPAGIEALQVI